jgi:maltose O-acetyltransferase
VSLIRERVWRVAVNILSASEATPLKYRSVILRKFGSQVGKRVIIQSGVKVSTPSLTIGDDVYINRDVRINNFARVEIKDKVALAPGVMVTTVGHDTSDPERRQGPTSFAPVVIGEGTWVGTRATILPGVTIGRGCVIAAGAIVNRDCEPNGLYGGTPARRIKNL